MPNKIVTFPNQQQETGSSTCGPTCLVNIYNYFDINVNLEKILKDLNTKKDVYTYTPQLAAHLQENGLKTKIFTCSFQTVSLEWQKLTKKELIKKLEEWMYLNHQSQYLVSVNFIHYYLTNNGDVSIETLTKKLIDNHLNDGEIILACLMDSWIWGKRKMHNVAKFDDLRGNGSGHFVVIYGKEKDNYLVSDPYPTGLKNKNGLYKIDKDQLLASILMWSQQVVTIKKSIKK